MRRTIAPILAVTALAGSAVLVAPAASAAPTDTYLITCTGAKVIKPRDFTLACGDASTEIVNIKWTSWDANTAKGTGILAWNTCLPRSCADGKVLKYKVRLRLAGLASGPDLNVFSKINVTFPDGGPAMLETGSYTIDNPVG